MMFSRDDVDFNVNNIVALLAQLSIEVAVSISTYFLKKKRYVGSTNNLLCNAHHT